MLTCVSSGVSPGLSVWSAVIASVGGADGLRPKLSNRRPTASGGVSGKVGASAAPRTTGSGLGEEGANTSAVIWFLGFLNFDQNCFLASIVSWESVCSACSLLKEGKGGTRAAGVGGKAA